MSGGLELDPAKVNGYGGVGRGDALAVESL